MIDTRLFYTADDIASILSVSRPTAYRIIKRLNDELTSKGFIVISGRVPKKYFDEKFYC
ncbi:MAG: transcriptional regulator [Huintestinicola sp.]